MLKLLFASMVDTEIRSYPCQFIWAF